MSKSIIKAALLLATALSFGPVSLLTPAANSQSFTNPDRPLKLAPDSPYRDADIIYLEADELINDETGNTLTARGEVEGRYQDRTLRADSVVYDLETGRVIASGSVVLIDASGAVQYADKLELSNELEAGTAAGFTSRFANGGVSGAAIATRREDGGVDLYNAYYTACKACEDKNPTWQIKARRVSQDTDRNMIRYQDAFFEFLGVPFFYTPYLAHADPTAGRTNGFLSPFVGISQSKGFNFRAPYYIALSPYSELTITPRVFARVNPVLGYQYRRKFYTGEINVDGSITYASAFDNNGDSFTDTNTFNRSELAPLGKRIRSHFFADGLFDLSEKWDFGFGVQLTSDDLYLNRYDFDEVQPKFGLYDGDNRTLVSQVFAVGQDDTFRFSTSAFGFQSLLTNIRQDEDDENNYFISSVDDSTLPIVAPKIELSKFLTDPLLGGRLEAFGDLTISNRKVGTDYTRITSGLNWNKTYIAPGGIEAKPFGEARFDYFEFDADDASKVDFDRTTGQIGLDVRWPFMKSSNGLDLIVEPRMQVTQNFGDGLNENFTIIDDNGSTVSLFQDSLEVDLDHSLLWSSNKSTGYDLWQKGFRADIGGSVTALWGDNHMTTFVGQSYASDFDDVFENTTGLSDDKTDIVGLFELGLGRSFTINTRVRYDDDTNKFRRLDTGFRYNHSRFSLRGNYYRLDSTALNLIRNPEVPEEQIFGSASLKLNDNWRTTLTAFRDLDEDITRRLTAGLTYHDDCTRIEFMYTRNKFDDAVRDNSGFGIRVSLLTLGDFAPD